MRPFVRSQKLVAVTAAMILAAGAAATATAAGTSAPKVDSPSSSQPADEQVQAVGERLAASLESLEKVHWGLESGLPAQHLTLTPAAAEDWADVTAELRDGAADSAGLVSVEDVAVDVAAIRLDQAPDGGTVAVVDVHVVRDVAELPADEEWEEVIPFHLELTPTGEVAGVTAQDLAWQLADR